MAAYCHMFQDWLQIFAPSKSHEKKRIKAIIAGQKNFDLASL